MPLAYISCIVYSLDPMLIWQRFQLLPSQPHNVTHGHGRCVLSICSTRILTSHSLQLGDKITDGLKISIWNTFDGFDANALGLHLLHSLHKLHKCVHCVLNTQAPIGILKLPSTVLNSLCNFTMIPAAFQNTFMLRNTFVSSSRYSSCCVSCAIKHNWQNSEYMNTHQKRQNLIEWMLLQP